MGSGNVATTLLVVVAFGALLLAVALRVRRDAARETQRTLPNPLADSPAVSATLAALGPQLAPSGAAGWLVAVVGSERAAVEAIVESLQPGLPTEGPFSVNRLVGRAPVRLDGEVRDGVPVVTAVQRLAEPSTS